MKGYANLVMQQRAFDIADANMQTQLECHCYVQDSPDGLRLYPADPIGQRVRRVCLAEPAIREAFEWLHRRGLAVIRVERATGLEFIAMVDPAKEVSE